MISVKRGRRNNYLLFDGDREVGEVWKMRKGSGFGMSLRGIYWRGGEPNTRGGSTGTRVARLIDAAPLAEKALRHNV